MGALGESGSMTKTKHSGNKVLNWRDTKQKKENNQRHGDRESIWIWASHTQHSTAQ